MQALPERLNINIKSFMLSLFYNACIHFSHIKIKSHKKDLYC